MVEAVEAVESRVTSKMQDTLSKPFTRDEVFCALSQMHPTKVLGPDDENIIFGRAYSIEIGVIKRILKVYENASGQIINLTKSDIMFSNGVIDHVADTLANQLGVRRVLQHGVYLSIPTNVGRSKGTIFRAIVNRVEKKLKDWKSSTLSQAGKTVLIKSVAQSILVLHHELFLLTSKHHCQN